ncbi:MAG: hypothetical protein KDK39_19395 [Leptospiraceae bacterium]|nr:hypothetical protein [Leptospiraceae bacterium]
MKNRLWLLMSLLVSLTLITPLFAQTGDEAAEEEAVSPGEESTDTTTETTTTTTSTATETASASAKLWKNEKTNTIYANSAQKFALSASDDLSNVDYIEYRIDDGNFQKYTGPLNVPDEGAHTIVYRAVDKAGNVEVDRVYNVIIDNSQPEIQIIPAKPFVNQNGRTYTSPGNTFTIRATDKYSGLKPAGIKYSVNGTALKSYNGTDAIKLTENGSQLIQYEAEDNLGNKASGTVLVNVDGEKPRVEIKPTNPLMHVGDKIYARRSTGFVVKGEDSGSAVDQILIKIDGSDEWQAFSDTIYFDEEKSHKIEAKAVDYVGNESETVTLEFFVDDNPPTTELKPVQ